MRPTFLLSHPVNTGKYALRSRLLVQDPSLRSVVTSTPWIPGVDVHPRNKVRTCINGKVHVPLPIRGGEMSLRNLKLLN